MSYPLHFLPPRLGSRPGTILHQRRSFIVRRLWLHEQRPLAARTAPGLTQQPRGGLDASSTSATATPDRGLLRLVFLRSAAGGTRLAETVFDALDQRLQGKRLAEKIQHAQLLGVSSVLLL